jgi:hypothetical protein
VGCGSSCSALQLDEQQVDFFVLLMIVTSTNGCMWIFLVLLYSCFFFMYARMMKCPMSFFFVSSGHGVCFFDVLHYLSLHLYSWMCEQALTSAMFLGVVLRLLV